MKEDQLVINSISKKAKNAVLEFFPNRFLILGLLLLYNLSCQQRKELIDEPLYEGPLSSMDSVNTIVSDSGIFVMRLVAPHQDEFESGDLEWNQGVYVEYFNDRGIINTIFSANHVTYNKAEKLYHAVGDVEVKNLQNGDELNTEELFWDEAKERYYTEKFVTIKSEGEVHTGEGLDANQDFTNYKILKPSGTFSIDEETNDSDSNNSSIKVNDEAI